MQQSMNHNLLQPLGTRSIRDVDLKLDIAVMARATHSLRKRTDHGQRFNLAGNGNGRDAARIGPTKLDIPRQGPAGMENRNVGNRGKTAAGKLLNILVIPTVVVVMSRAVSAAADSMTARV